jgi:hypothetical protein
MASEDLESLGNRHHAEVLTVGLALHSARLDLPCDHGYNARIPISGVRETV